jgi:hypothetical protein
VRSKSQRIFKEWQQKTRLSQEDFAKLLGFGWSKHRVHNLQTRQKIKLHDVEELAQTGLGKEYGHWILLLREAVLEEQKEEEQEAFAALRAETTEEEPLTTFLPQETVQEVTPVEPVPPPETVPETPPPEEAVSTLPPKEPPPEEPPPPVPEPAKEETQTQEEPEAIEPEPPEPEQPKRPLYVYPLAALTILTLCFLTWGLSHPDEIIKPLPATPTSGPSITPMLTLAYAPVISGKHSSIADINHDCITDQQDLDLLTKMYWCPRFCFPCNVPGDFNGDCSVDNEDLEILMAHWLDTCR